ncbi:MAG: DUF4301 family protein [Thermodesulfobacteriota bacterium]|nr:DUF4301 family protein [Thermodesulfobacteriota bacterium]
MMEKEFTDTDIEQIQAHGLSMEIVENQLAMFKKGVAVPGLVAPCTAGNGVKRLDDDAVIDRLIDRCNEAAAHGRITKFIPASGAATRMFKALLAVYYGDAPTDRETALQKAEKGDENHAALLDLMDHLTEYAFYTSLKTAMAEDGLDCDRHVADGGFQTVLEYLLTDNGLALADRPKGMIPFHRYITGTGETGVFTAFEEHIAESVACFMDQHDTCRLHFTVPETHRQRIEDLVRQSCEQYRQAGKTVMTTFSIQAPSTDTVAADMDNKPFRDENGRLVFRPGGHGALLDNLNALDGDILLIKNIDNVARPALRQDTAWALKAICGMLANLQEGITEHLHRLRIRSCSDTDIQAAMDFITLRLEITLSESIETGPADDRRAFLLSVLNRPTRVCGVVKNEGEPGGGPFFVKDENGMISGQIIESAQVDMNDPAQKNIWESATHFNPVIIACGVRDGDGNPFDLKRFSDPQAGIITEKSYNGRTLKALEHPGLWNGAMAHWNTVFVEIPSAAFNPVKTVFDLLRDGHRAEDHR